MSEGWVWNKNEKTAWDFARSTIERGLTATDGLRMYRESGDPISNESWYALCGQARDAMETGDRLMGLPGEPPIPGAVYTVVDLDLVNKYNVDVTVSYIDAATGQEVERTLRFGDNEEGSWDDVENGVTDRLNSYGVLGGDGSFEIISARFFTPTSMA
jgi:hypothetical protein